VTPFALAKQRHKHFRVAKNKLEFDGVEPALIRAFDALRLAKSRVRSMDGNV
jgi:hypothetical protein